MVRQLPGSSVTVSTIEPLPVIWQLLPQAKAKRQSKGLTAKSIGDLLPAQLWLVWLTSTNTGVFLVVSSHCWPWPGRLRRMCYYSCWTDSVWESESFQCFVNIGHWKGNNKWNFWWNLQEIVANQSSTYCFAQCSLMLNKLIISWSLSKNMTYKENPHNLNGDPVQSSRSKSRKGSLLRFKLNCTATQMAGSKSLEMVSGIILNWLKQNFAAKSVENEMRCLKL